MSIFKRIITAGAAAAILAASSLTAYAEAPRTETAAVAQTLGASAAEWNGKTALQAGKSYVVSKNVSISKSVTIPAKTTVTVKNGAKLWITSNGKLLVKGTLKMQKGSTLAVTGTLNLYKGKVLSSSGEVRFGNKSTVTLSGKFTSTQYGSITGEPKKLTVGDSAVINITGKNSSSKLDTIVKSAGAEKMVNSFFVTAIEKQDIYSALKAAYPQKMIDRLTEIFSENGASLKNYCKEFGKEYFAEIEAQGIDLSDVSVSVKLSGLSSDKAASDKWVTDIYGKNCGFYKAEAKITMKSGKKTLTEEMTLHLIQSKDGAWYYFYA